MRYLFIALKIGFRRRAPSTRGEHWLSRRLPFVSMILMVVLLPTTGTTQRVAAADNHAVLFGRRGGLSQKFATLVRSNAPRDVSRPIEVLEGDKIESGKYRVNYAYVRFGNQAMVKLNSKTSVTVISALRVTEPPQARLETRLKCEQGSLFVRIGKQLKAPSRFTVETGTAVTGADGTRFAVKVENDSTEIVVEEGIVKVFAKNNPGRIISVGEGYKLLVTRQAEQQENPTTLDKSDGPVVDELRDLPPPDDEPAIIANVENLHAAVFSHTSSAIRPDTAARLLISYGNGKVRLLHAATGYPICSLDGHVGEVHALAISTDGKEIVTGGWDGEVGLWKIGTATRNPAEEEGNKDDNAQEQKKPPFAQASCNDSVQTQPDEKKKSEDDFKRIEKAVLARPFRGHSARITAVALAGSGQSPFLRVASADEDGHLILWNTQTGEAALSKRFPARITCLYHDGSAIYVGAASGQVWTVAIRRIGISGAFGRKLADTDPQLLYTLQGSIVSFIKPTSVGNLISLGSDGVIATTTTTSIATRDGRSVRLPVPVSFKAFDGEATAFGYSDPLYVLGGSSGHISVWSKHTGLVGGDDDLKGRVAATTLGFGDMFVMAVAGNKIGFWWLQ